MQRRIFVEDIIDQVIPTIVLKRFAIDTELESFISFAQNLYAFIGDSNLKLSQTLSKEVDVLLSDKVFHHNLLFLRQASINHMGL